MVMVMVLVLVAEVGARQVVKCLLGGGCPVLVRLAGAGPYKGV